MNLVEPLRVGPDVAYDRVTVALRAAGGEVAGAELVGLLPQRTLEAIDPGRWAELDLGPDRTIEARRAGSGR